MATVVANDPDLVDTYPFNTSTGKVINLPRTMCENVLYNDKAMSGLANHPPVSLVQPYFQCHDTALMGIESVVGSAIGVANVIANVVMIVLGYFMVLGFNYWAQRRNVELLKTLKPGKKPKGTFKGLVVTEINQSKVNRRLDELTRDYQLYLFKSIISCNAAQATEITKLKRTVEVLERQQTQARSDLAGLEIAVESLGYDLDKIPAAQPSTFDTVLDFMSAPLALAQVQIGGQQPFNNADFNADPNADPRRRSRLPEWQSPDPEDAVDR
jgi:hypothetical protein